MEPNETFIRKPFIRRKPATNPQIIPKRNRQCTRKRKSKQKREINRKHIRGSSGAERTIQSEKACYEATIQSEAKPTKHQEENE
jgi:hypothetical protein